MKKALVAGGAGFIGSHLCRALLDKGLKVICVDNFITGSRRNIAPLLGNPNFEFIKADVSKRILKVNRADFIFHLASPASPVDYQNYPEETLLANSLGTINLLKLAVREGAEFLFASTSEVYGDPLEHPQKETLWSHFNTFGSRACYDVSKAYGEAAVYTYIRKCGANARVVRIFNTYGPNMQKDDGRVISNFINQALEGKPVTIYGRGEQTRSFCYVSDMVRGLMAMMFTEGLRGEVVNLGNPGEYTMLELAEKIIKLTGTKSKLTYKPLPQDDPTRRRPDISKAKRVLGWQPEVKLKEGLKKTIAYYRG